MVDPSFAKKQLDLMTREWYMKPDGALPAYEWNFSDVNPPVHAWATFRVFKIERKMFGREDLDFLERVFQKLLLNFTWCVPRRCPGRTHASVSSLTFAGGSTGRMPMETMSLKVDSWVWTTLGHSTDPSHCQRAERSDRPMELPGWPSSVSTCEYQWMTGQSRG